MLKCVTIAVAAAACAAAAGAQAEDVHLKFGDLDLTQPAQVRVLDQRITQSAESWCKGQTVTGTRLPIAGCATEAKAALISALPAVTQKAYKAGMAVQPAMVQASIPAPHPAAR